MKIDASPGIFDVVLLHDIPWLRNATKVSFRILGCGVALEILTSSDRSVTAIQQYMSLFSLNTSVITKTRNEAISLQKASILSEHVQHICLFETPEAIVQVVALPGNP